MRSPFRERKNCSLDEKWARNSKRFCCSRPRCRKSQRNFFSLATRKSFFPRNEVMCASPPHMKWRMSDRRCATCQTWYLSLERKVKLSNLSFVSRKVVCLSRDCLEFAFKRHSGWRIDRRTRTSQPKPPRERKTIQWSKFMHIKHSSRSQINKFQFIQHEIYLLEFWNGFAWGGQAIYEWSADPLKVSTFLMLIDVIPGLAIHCKTLRVKLKHQKRPRRWDESIKCGSS